MTKAYLKERIIAGGVIFMIFAILYFIPQFALPHKIFIPLFTLGLFSIGLLPWPMCLALFFSALGDLSGSFKATTSGNLAFIGQMGGFAIAHVFFIIYFLHRGLKNKKKAKKGDGIYLGACLALCVYIFGKAMADIVPCVNDPVLKIGVIAYACVIVVMAFSALMQKDWIFGAGALLFVASDFILAWNMFVGAVPGEKYLIMVSYYAAQAILTGRALWTALKPRQEAPSKKNKNKKA